MIDTATTVRVAEVAAADKNRHGTIKLPYIEVGRLIRGEFKFFLQEIVRNGGQVKFDALDKGFFTSTYYGVEFSGPAYLLNAIIVRLNEMDQD